ncbi:MAG: CARDB domain-containing protein [Candidatus Sumerlaeaceae bacterium]
MLSWQSKALAALTIVCVAASPALLSAKKPEGVGGGNGNAGGNKGDGTGADLTGVSIVFKTKCDATTCTVNNLTLTVRNQGGDDAKNSRVEFYLSDDTTLTTTPDELSSTTDSLIHRVALGTVKAKKTKKRTVGGGLLKQLAAHSGQYVIALLDADNTTSESNELNNVVVSEPIP